MGMSSPRRGDVYWISLDPTEGKEIKKTRPCMIVSPDYLNCKLETFLVAPMTTGGHRYDTRIPCRFDDKNAFIVADQLRVIDQGRLIEYMGEIPGRVR